MEKEYTVVIIDIANSRSMLSDDRTQVQKALMKGIEDANDFLYGKYGGEERDIYVPFDFSGGDSVMGLFLRVEDAASAIHLILGSVGYNAPVRVAIGRGEWTTKIDCYGVNAQDGPAFHAARTSLEWARKHDEHGYCLVVTYDHVVLIDEDFDVDHFIAHVADEFEWDDFLNLKKAVFSLKTMEEIYKCHISLVEAKEKIEKN